NEPGARAVFAARLGHGEPVVPAGGGGPRRGDPGEGGRGGRALDARPGGQGRPPGHDALLGRGRQEAVRARLRLPPVGDPGVTSAACGFAVQPPVARPQAAISGRRSVLGPGRPATTLLVSEVFPPAHGGSGRWFWEIY